MSEKLLKLPDIFPSASNSLCHTAGTLTTLVKNKKNTDFLVPFDVTNIVNLFFNVSGHWQRLGCESAPWLSYYE